MRRVITLLLSLAMVLTLATTAFAATITIDDGNVTGAEYVAYKLLNVTVSEPDENGKSSFGYTINEKYREVLNGVLTRGDIQPDEGDAGFGYTELEDAEIIKRISEMDPNAIRIFADDVYTTIKAAELDADYTTTTNEFKNVDKGYYLIAESKTGSSGEGEADDTYSLVMLDTTDKDEVTIETKEETPDLEKKVQEKNDSDGTTSDWQDGADYDIGDDVPFKLTGTVSDKYDSYKTYYYAFHDQMHKGLTFNEDSVVVKVDGKVITEGYRVEFPPRDQDTFDLIFDDLKLIESVTKDSVITVEFTATLNKDAEIGAPGNPNEAKLEYSNNPYDEGEGKPETGETPEDKVVVFTYMLNADKVNEKGEALEGAGFTLYKFDKEKNDWVAVGPEITGVTSFTFTGLDAGDYKLVETTVPAGYNKADDIYFTIEATYDTEADDPKLTGLVVKDSEGNVISEGEEPVFNTSITDGYVNTDVVNNSGTELPSTGGIGTTLFYIIGGVLMVGAMVLLITKKRMSAE